MIDTLVIYNFGNSIYFWLLLIGFHLLIIGAVILYIARHGFSEGAIGILVYVGIFLVIGFFGLNAPKNSNGFGYNINKEIEENTYLVYNKYNGSFEYGNMRIYSAYDFNKGGYAIIEDDCSFVCNENEHAKLIKIFNKKDIKLDYMLSYLINYASANKEDANIVFSVGGSTIEVVLDHETKNIKYTISYRDEYYDKDRKEKVSREDSLEIKHYEGYDDIDALIIEEIFDEDIGSFDSTTNNNIYTYKKVSLN